MTPLFLSGENAKVQTHRPLLRLSKIQHRFSTNPLCKLSTLIAFDFYTH